MPLAVVNPSSQRRMRAEYKSRYIKLHSKLIHAATGKTRYAQPLKFQSLSSLMRIKNQEMGTERGNASIARVIHTMGHYGYIYVTKNN